MFRETRTARLARSAYDVHETWRRETLLHAIKVLKQAHEDKAASILHGMLDAEQPPERVVS